MSSPPHTQATSPAGDTAGDNPAAEVPAASASHAQPFPTSSLPSNVIRDDVFAGDPAKFPYMQCIKMPSGLHLTFSPCRDESGPAVHYVLVSSECTFAPCMKALVQAPEHALWHVRFSSDGWLEVLKKPDNGTVRYEFGGTRPAALLRWAGKFEVAIEVVLRGGREVKAEEAGEVKAEEAGEVKAEDEGEVEVEEPGAEMV